MKIKVVDMEKYCFEGEWDKNKRYIVFWRLEVKRKKEVKEKI